MIMSYRQYCGVGTTHGQLGGAVTEDGEAWDAFFNLNANGNPPWGGGAGVALAATAISDLHIVSKETPVDSLSCVDTITHSCT